MNDTSGCVTKLDQRSYVKIETLHGRTPTEIHRPLKEVCGGDTLDRANISRWAARFSSGRESIEDKPRAGRQRTARNSTNSSIVATLIEKDCRMTCEEIARAANIKDL